MTEQETINVVRQGYQLYQQGDLQGLMALFTDDIEWVTAEVEGVPFSGAFHGKDEVVRYFTTFNQALRTTRFEVREIIAQEDKAAVIVYFSGEAIPTGQRFDNEMVHVLHYKDGKLLRFQQFGDTAPARNAFSGAQMATGAGAGASGQPLH